MYINQRCCWSTILLCLLVVMTPACESPSAHRPAEFVSPLADHLTTDTTPTAEEYAVYSALIGQVWSGPPYVILDQTRNSHLEYAAQQIGQNIPSLAAETLAHFLAANQEVYPIDPQFGRDPNFTLISQDVFQKIIGRDFQNLQRGWENFARTYPTAHGLYALSRVGFNADKTQALVYFDNSQAPLDAVGCYVFLTQADGVWTVQQKIMAWMA